MCSNCKYLDLNDKKEGVVGGAIYYCKLKKQYVYATDKPCAGIEKDNKRDKDTINKIIDESEKFDDIPLSPTAIFIIIFILIIMGYFMGVFK